MDGVVPQPAPASGEKLKKILIIVGVAVGGLALLGGGIVFLVYSLTKGPADAAERFLNHIAAGETQAAYEGTAGVFKQYTSIADFEALISQNAVLSQLAEISLPNRSIENDNATVAGTLTAKSGETAAVEVGLQKEQGEWKVVGMTVEGGFLPGTGPSAEEQGESAPREGETQGQNEGEGAAALPEYGRPPANGQGIFVQIFDGALGDRFDIYDAEGREKLDGYQPANQLISAAPGTYTLFRYANTDLRYAPQVVVQPGKVAVVSLGALKLELVPDTAAGERYDIFDASGTKKVSGYEPGNSLVTLPPGTYMLYRYANKDLLYAREAVVQAGKVTTVPLGAIQYNGTTRFDVFDASGTKKLSGYEAPETVIAFPPGDYMLKKYASNLVLVNSLRVEAGKTTVVQ